MSSEEQILSSRTAQGPSWMIFFKRTVIVVVALHLLIGLISSYRAYFQVHSVNINSSGLLQEGLLIQTKVVSYGRTPVDLRLEIIQNGNVVGLQEHRVAANEFGFYDPRTQTELVLGTDNPAGIGSTGIWCSCITSDCGRPAPVDASPAALCARSQRQHQVVPSSEFRVSRSSSEFRVSGSKFRVRLRQTPVRTLPGV